MYQFQANICVFCTDYEIMRILVYRPRASQAFRDKGHADLMFSDVTSTNKIHDRLFTGINTTYSTTFIENKYVSKSIMLLVF